MPKRRRLTKINLKIHAVSQRPTGGSKYFIPQSITNRIHSYSPAWCFCGALVPLSNTAPPVLYANPVDNPIYRNPTIMGLVNIKVPNTVFRSDILETLRKRAENVPITLYSTHQKAQRTPAVEARSTISTILTSLPCRTLYMSLSRYPMNHSCSVQQTLRLGLPLPPHSQSHRRTLHTSRLSWCTPVNHRHSLTYHKAPTPQCFSPLL